MKQVPTAGRWKDGVGALETGCGWLSRHCRCVLCLCAALFQVGAAHRVALSYGADLMLMLILMLPVVTPHVQR